MKPMQRTVVGELNRIRFLVLAGWLLGVVAGSPVCAQTRHLGFGTEPQVGIKGSDLLLPLLSSEVGGAWPETIGVSVGSKRLRASIVWLVPRWPVEAEWVGSDAPVWVERHALGRSQSLPGQPMLLVPIPWDASGVFRALGGEWAMEWVDPPPPLTGEEMSAVVSDHVPLLDDPFEYFRWVLKAETIGARPPVFQGSSDARRVALSEAMRWRVALARTMQTSRGIAAEVRERLLATVRDGTRPREEESIAGWLTGHQDLAVLRSILLQPLSIDQTAVARAGLAWLEAQPQFTAWFDSVAGERVTVALLNPLPVEALITAQWHLDAAPTGLLCPALSLSRHVLERPSALAGRSASGNETLLLATTRGAPRRLEAGPGSMPVRPPGALLGPMMMPLTLAAANGGFRDAPPAAYSTHAIVRRRFGRWEVFLECRWPQGGGDDWVLLQLGAATQPIALLEVTSEGSWRVRRGGEERSLKVSVKSFADRWRCEIVLPEQWLVRAIEADSGGLIRLGIRRNAPGGIRQFLGLAPPAWQSTIRELGFDLGAWGDAIPVKSSE